MKRAYLIGLYLVGMLWPLGYWKLLSTYMQMLTAKFVAGAPGLPVDVATALCSLLDGNVKKVMISVALWLPYLLLSTRVNVTYRNRVPA